MEGAVKTGAGPGFFYPFVIDRQLFKAKCYRSTIPPVTGLGFISVVCLRIPAALGDRRSGAYFRPQNMEQVWRLFLGVNIIMSVLGAIAWVVVMFGASWNCLVSDGPQ